jgi:hypothetical protein
MRSAPHIIFVTQVINQSLKACHICAAANRIIAVIFTSEIKTYISPMLLILKK